MRISVLHFQLKIIFRSNTLVRNYRRPTGRTGIVTGILSQEEEHAKLIKRNIEVKNPKQSNANYTDFNPNDPVTDSLVKMWETSKKDKKVIKPRNQAISKSIHQSKSKHVLAPGIVQIVSSRGLKYSEVNDKNGTFNDDMIKLKSKKKREALGEIVLDGTLGIKKALQFKGTMKRLYFTNEETLRVLPLDDSTKKTCQFYKVPIKQMKFWTESFKSSGSHVIGVFDKPDIESIKKLDTNLIPMTIILDQVHSSEMISRILKAAVAFGCANILVMANCTDIWETNVLKAGIGCHFNISIHDKVEWKYIDDFVPNPSQLILLDIFGLMKDPKQHVMDPTKLNEMVSEIESDIENYSESDNDGNRGYTSADHLSNYEHIPLPLTELSDLNINPGSHIVFVISGIKRFTSLEAKKLIFDNLGSRVVIPMASKIIGFDVDVGSSIVMHHIFKQLNIKKQNQPPKEDEGEEEEKPPKEDEGVEEET